MSLLPNPEGSDHDGEKAAIANGSATAVDVSGWTLRDRAGNEFPLQGSVAPHDTLVIVLSPHTMPLNNSGDDVYLMDHNGDLAHVVHYEASDVREGVPIRFAADGRPETSLWIVALLANPTGNDRDREEAAILNRSAATADVAGWVLRDRAGNEFPLQGTVGPYDTLVIVLSPHTMPLNNSGDDVYLVDPDGHAVHQVHYERSDVTEGSHIRFSADGLPQ